MAHYNYKNSQKKYLTITLEIKPDLNQVSQVEDTVIEEYSNVPTCFIVVILRSPNVLYKGSYMSAHVLLHLSKKMGKEIKCEACQAFYLFFATSLINSMIQEHEC